MCARYTVNTPADALAALFLALPPPAEPTDGPRFNIAPSQRVPVLILDRGQRCIVPMRWGFLPSWAREAKQAVVNARSETAFEKPFFRSAMRARRCLMPASGFYEWKTESDGKQPYLFEQASGAPFAFAALWERWTPAPDAAPAGVTGPVDTVCLLTTSANGTLSPIHDRMPVILPDEARWRTWLDPRADREALEALLRPSPDDLLTARPVSRRLNNPRAEGPELWQT